MTVPSSLTLATDHASPRTERMCKCEHMCGDPACQPARTGDGLSTTLSCSTSDSESFRGQLIEDDDFAMACRGMLQTKMESRDHCSVQSPTMARGRDRRSIVERIVVLASPDRIKSQQCARARRRSMSPRETPISLRMRRMIGKQLPRVRSRTPEPRKKDAQELMHGRHAHSWHPRALKRTVVDDAEPVATIDADSASTNHHDFALLQDTPEGSTRASSSAASAAGTPPRRAHTPWSCMPAASSRAIEDSSATTDAPPQERPSRTTAPLGCSSNAGMNSSTCKVQCAQSKRTHIRPTRHIASILKASLSAAE